MDLNDLIHNTRELNNTHGIKLNYINTIQKRCHKLYK